MVLPIVLHCSYCNLAQPSKIIPDPKKGGHNRPFFIAAIQSISR